MTCEPSSQTMRTFKQNRLLSSVSCRAEVILFPKFHCKLNPIERVWGQAKVYTRTYTNFTLPRLRANVNPALNSVSTCTDLIRKYFRRILEYERAYLDGKKAGKELEQAVKVYKSHRRIFSSFCHIIYIHVLDCILFLF